MAQGRLHQLLGGRALPPPRVQQVVPRVEPHGPHVAEERDQEGVALRLMTDQVDELLRVRAAVAPGLGGRVLAELGRQLADEGHESGVLAGRDDERLDGVGAALLEPDLSRHVDEEGVGVGRVRPRQEREELLEPDGRQQRPVEGRLPGLERRPGDAVGELLELAALALGAGARADGRVRAAQGAEEPGGPQPERPPGHHLALRHQLRGQVGAQLALGAAAARARPRQQRVVGHFELPHAVAPAVGVDVVEPLGRGDEPQKQAPHLPVVGDHAAQKQRQDALLEVGAGRLLEDVRDEREGQPAAGRVGQPPADLLDQRERDEGQVEDELAYLQNVDVAHVDDFQNPRGVEHISIGFPKRPCDVISLALRDAPRELEARLGHQHLADVVQQPLQGGGPVVRRHGRQQLLDPHVPGVRERRGEQRVARLVAVAAFVRSLGRRAPDHDHLGQVVHQRGEEAALGVSGYRARQKELVEERAVEGVEPAAAAAGDDGAPEVPGVGHGGVHHLGGHQNAVELPVLANAFAAGRHDRSDGCWGGVLGVGGALELQRGLVRGGPGRRQPQLGVGAVEDVVRGAQEADGEGVALEYLGGLELLELGRLQRRLRFLRGQLEARLGVPPHGQHRNHVDGVLLEDGALAALHVAAVPGGGDVRPLVHVRELALVARLVEQRHELGVEGLRGLAHEDAEDHVLVGADGPEQVRVRGHERGHEGAKVLVRVVGDEGGDHLGGEQTPREGGGLVRLGGRAEAPQEQPGGARAPVPQLLHHRGVGVHDAAPVVRVHSAISTRVRHGRPGAGVDEFRDAGEAVLAAAVAGVHGGGRMPHQAEGAGEVGEGVPRGRAVGVQGARQQHVEHEEVRRRREGREGVGAHRLVAVVEQVGDVLNQHGGVCER
ncbi:monoculm1, putative [Babesia caballi]|uniref:Monoculm1, putative n=1 Tax=Babesia caballi TaxID=5871 RepID=A0AAV4LY98_BABCB|nr:monoculm1, putative [Babesia caballi]